MSNFTHLHVHTQYSVLDGAAKIKKLIAKTKEMGMAALAITDHGNMFGVMEFTSEAEKQGIKPIVGCELYVAEGSRFDKKGREDRSGYHLIVLAKNENGYHNLARLCSLGHKKDAFYYTPRIDHELLEKYHEDLIVCSACLGGEIPQMILSGQETKLRESIEFHKRLFGEDYYFELQNHIKNLDQPKVNTRLLELAKEYNIKCILTNDVHFVDSEDKDAHRILICLNTGKKLSEDTKLVYTGEEFLKSPEEMAALFPDHPELLSNTQEIVDKVEPFKLTRPILLPKFSLPEGFTDEMEYLRYITYEGAVKRWGENYATDPDTSIKERLDFELATVARMGFPGYFLIVWDFIKAARNMGVLVGPGRGSAAGSAIAYAIGITNMDPIKYKLLFERFLNPERISMPDVDIDFDDVGRERVIQYVVGKYGEERVAQIITFGSMAAKSSIKDVARVLELPLTESNRVSGLIPDMCPSLEKAFESEPLLVFERDNGSDLVRKTIHYAMQLEGSIRSTGTHACGMIIAPEDLIDHVPLSTSKDTDMPVTQYEGTYVEPIGLLKMDFLGLKTLTIIHGALDNIKLRHGIEVDIDTLPLDDALTYELFSKGDTNGVFQFESDGMKKHLRDLKPNRLEDLIAMNALYRPGPMEYIPKFIRRKFGLEPIEYELEGMEEFLQETYGITVYQEQVMLLSQKLANFSKGDADTLRKAMGKKKIEILQKMKTQFMEGCQANGHDLKICEKIWTDWEAFASYAFNKSHSTCYAYIAFQTAYLKAHYPAEFMASVLTNNLKDINKISFFMDECKYQKIDLLGPDVNESQANFTVNKAGAIRFGLSGIKNVGEAAVAMLIEERNNNGNYKDIFDFVQRVNLRSISKKCMESLIKAGAFDSFPEPSRATYFFQKAGESVNFLDNLMSYASKYQVGQQSTQVSLFGDAEEDSTFMALEIPICEEWSNIEQLKNEKEVTGFYISGHPLDDYKLELKQFSSCTLADLKNGMETLQNKDLKFGGVITAVAHAMTKNGKAFGRFTLEDYENSMEFLLWNEDYLKFKHFMIEGTFVFIRASVKQNWRQEYEPKILHITLLDELLDKQTRRIIIHKNLSEINKVYTNDLKSLVKTYKIELNPKNKDTVPMAHLEFRIKDPLQGYAVSMPARDTEVSPASFVKAYMQFDALAEIALS
ncbi:MAG: DNA polymerase III subunit alpha [Bacteroidales bacterium]